MGYDSWKTSNPADATLGDNPKYADDDCEDQAYRDRSGRIDPFKFALKSSQPAAPEQTQRAGLGPSQSSAAENDCEQDEGA